MAIMCSFTKKKTFSHKNIIISEFAVEQQHCATTIWAYTLLIMNTASKLGPHTQADRGTCPGVGL
jgi:hypothetical protein